MQDKPYTLNDGAGLSLLVDVNGAKGWRYRFVGKPKMILFGVNGEVRLQKRAVDVKRHMRCWLRGSTPVMHVKPIR